jgi:hypothetical protein
MVCEQTHTMSRALVALSDRLGGWGLVSCCGDVLGLTLSFRNPDEVHGSPPRISLESDGHYLRDLRIIPEMEASHVLPPRVLQAVQRRATGAESGWSFPRACHTLGGLRVVHVKTSHYFKYGLRLLRHFIFEHLEPVLKEVIYLLLLALGPGTGCCRQNATNERDRPARGVQYRLDRAAVIAAFASAFSALSGTLRILRRILAFRGIILSYPVYTHIHQC